MRYDSVVALKSELRDEDRADERSARAAAFGVLADVEIADERPSMALGVSAGTRRSDYRLYARVTNQEDADHVLQRAHGEAVVRIIHEVQARPTPGWLQGRHRPGVPGLSVSPWGKSYRGTIGFYAWDRDTDQPVLVSNNHVLADEDRVPIGTPIIQPGGASERRNIVGVLDRATALRFGGAPNVIDAARAALRGAGDFFEGWNDAFASQRVSGFRALTRGDLGAPAAKIGSTTAITRLVVSAVEVDGLAVRYGRGSAVFNDQHEFTGAGTAPGSLGGDSGSAIGVGENIVALLFAGGVDSGGTDRTFGNPSIPVRDGMNVRL